MVDKQRLLDELKQEILDNLNDELSESATNFLFYFLIISLELYFINNKRYLYFYGRK
jgi:hypothetical protein